MTYNADQARSGKGTTTPGAWTAEMKDAPAESIPARAALTPEPVTGEYTHLAGDPVTEKPGTMIDIDGTVYRIAPAGSEFDIVEPITGEGVKQGWPLSDYDYAVIQTPEPVTGEYSHLAGDPVTEKPGSRIDIDGNVFVIAPAESGFEILDPETGEGVTQGWPLSAFDYTAVRTVDSLNMKYVIVEGGIVQSCDDEILVMDLDALDDTEFASGEARAFHVDHLVWMSDVLASRDLTDWSAPIDDRIRELNPDIVRTPTGTSTTYPVILIMEGGLVRDTVNAEGLVIVDLDELDSVDINDDRRRELMAELASAGGAGGDAYEQIRNSAVTPIETSRAAKEPAAV